MNNLLAIQGGMPEVSHIPRRHWPFYSQDVEEQIIQRVREGNIDAVEVDPLIKEVETIFTNSYCQGEHGIFCGSGTDALLTAYFSLGLEYGAEVLVPTNTFRTTVTPLLLLNLRPVLCDSNPETGGIDLDDAKARITSRTRALVITHLWGHPVNCRNAQAIAEKYGLALVEDCSHAHGATWEGQPVGTFGDVAAFSLGTKKMVSGGTAGILVTKNLNIYERALIFSQPKHRAAADMRDPALRRYLGSGFGVNLRGTPIAAALVLDHLRRLPATITIKNQNLSLLSQAIGENLPGLKPFTKQEGFTNGTWYTFQCSWQDDVISRDSMLRALQAEGVLVSKPRNMLHREPIFIDPSPMTSYKFERKPIVEQSQYRVSDSLYNNLITWHTRELYDPAEDVIQSYGRAFHKINCNLDSLRKFQQQLT